MPNPTPNSKYPQAYNIAEVGTNDAEINLYGEVVATRPVDFWTGKPLPGDYIEQDAFLRDLDELSTKDNITVHINSVGGDFYAGLAIYNRLRSLNASITTINDSLAASAGSIIFMAGDKGKRKVNAGSNLMIHGVLSFLFGYYNTVDLKAQIKQLDAHNKAAAAAYAEATGLDAETIKAAMSKDTYMTGQEAVDAGWADEVIGTDAQPVAMALTPDRSLLMVGGHKIAARCFGKLPDNIPVLENEPDEETAQNMAQPATQVDIKNTQNGGKNMEIKNMEDLRAAYPDLLSQAETAARSEGVAAERARIQGIEEIEATIGDAVLVNSAKFGDKPMNAEQLAFAALKAQAAIGATVLNKLENDTKASGADGVAATPAATAEPTDDEKSVNLLLGRIPNMKEGK